jgi:hypothetical protein
MLRAVPQKHMSVSGEEVRGRGHNGRLGFGEWFEDVMGYIVFSSGLRVLAAHDQARWGLDLEDVGGGHERPDARWGAVWRAVPRKGCFCKRWSILTWVARVCRGDDFQNSESCALLCVPSGVATDPPTWVSWAQLGGGGRCVFFNGPYVHQSVAHREAMPGAKTVGVAHSSYRPIPLCGSLVL